MMRETTGEDQSDLLELVQQMQRDMGETGFTSDPFDEDLVMKSVKDRLRDYGHPDYI